MCNWFKHPQKKLYPSHTLGQSAAETARLPNSLGAPDFTQFANDVQTILDEPSYQASDHLHIVCIQPTQSMMTQIVWSVIRYIAGARNRVRCAYDYDGSFDLNERSVDATYNPRECVLHCNRTETFTMLRHNLGRERAKMHDIVLVYGQH